MSIMDESTHDDATITVQVMTPCAISMRRVIITQNTDDAKACWLFMETFITYDDPKSMIQGTIRQGIW